MVIFVAKRIWAGKFEQVSYSNLIMMFIALIWFPLASNNTTP